MIPHAALPVAAWWYHSAHWVRINGHWVRLRQEESREWEPMPGGRTDGEREGGNGGDASFALQWWLLPHVCLLGYLFSALFCFSINPSIHLFTWFPPPQHTHTHALHCNDCLHIPCDHLSSPLLLYFPSPSPFNIKPLTLCGKWAHSPIQCLLRHDGSAFHIKTDKAGLGCRSGESGRSNARCRMDVEKEREWIQYKDEVCTSWTELKFTEDAVANSVWGGGRSIAGSWDLRSCRGNKGSDCYYRRGEP